MEYVIKKINDLCTVTSSKRIYAKQYVEDGIPFYRSKEIIEKNQKQNISEPLFISKEVYENIKEKFGVPQEGDLLLTSVGTLGIPYIVKDETFYFKDGNLTWMKNFSKDANSIYVFYWLSSQFGKDALINRAIGSSQGAITIDILKKYKILVPNIEIQKKIVKILKKYDDLIENNNHRIKLLENMAEEIYKEWFIRFRFPEYEKANFKDSIPKGWQYKKFNEIFKYIRGVSYSSEEIESDDGIDFVNLKNIQSYGGFRRDGLKKYSGKYKEEQKVKYHDLVMGVTDMTQERRTVGAVALIPKIDGVITMDLIKLLSEIDNTFWYCLFKYGYYSKMISQFGNGANVIHLRPESIKNQKILLPDEKTIDRFVEVVKPIFDEIEELYLSIENLVSQRDLLLPRLMSGKIDLTNKEIV